MEIKVIKVIIKNTKVSVIKSSKNLLISDAEVNKIINQPKKSRGRIISKDKLVRLSKHYRFNNSLYYELNEKLDDCYFNNVMLNK